MHINKFILLCFSLVVATLMSLNSNSPYKGLDRAFCVRMKSTLTKRGCHFKSSGYRVSSVWMSCFQFKSQTRNNSNGNQTFASEFRKETQIWINYVPTGQTATAILLQICIWEIPGLNLNSDIACHLWGFVVLFRPSNKSRDPYRD
jgi:hypothetical protein